jgi:hypothetical protein
MAETPGLNWLCVNRTSQVSTLKHWMNRKIIRSVATSPHSASRCPYAFDRVLRKEYFSINVFSRKSNDTVTEVLLGRLIRVFDAVNSLSQRLSDGIEPLRYLRHWKRQQIERSSADFVDVLWIDSKLLSEASKLHRAVSQLLP